MKRRCILVLVIIGVTGGDMYGQGQLLLSSGFESGVSVNGAMNDLVGADRSARLGWETSADWIESSRFVYLVRDKALSDYMTSFITRTTGPFGTPTRVLCMENIADDPDHPSTSRNEYSLFGRKPPNDFQEGYVRYWMKLQADLLGRIPPGRSTPWYMIMEWKEPNSGIKRSAAECEAIGQGAGGSNNYRINIGIERATGESQFRWRVIGQHPQPCRHTEWSHTNDHVEVPLGRWFMVEGYMKKHASQGRVYFAVDGQVVLDTRDTRPAGFAGRTQHAENPMPLRFWSPLKNYHSMEWNQQGPVSQWYDEFELWTDFPPGHPAVRDEATDDSVIFREHFNYPDGPLPGHWWSEGNRAEIRDGRLYVHADQDPFARATAWLDREMHGNLRIEYDACVLSSRDGANNLNFFLFYADPKGRPLRASRQEREDGNYPRYHNLNGYILTNVAKDQDVPRHRLRFCPGFQLIDEEYQYENKPHTVYHVTIEKRGHHLTYAVNGNEILAATLDAQKKVYERGLLGFRTWHTELWWDNLVVTRLSD